MTDHLHCTADEPCDSAEEQPRRRATDSDAKFLDSPFWRVMSFVVVSLFTLAVYVFRTNMERLDKVNDGQIEMKTLMRVVIDQQAAQQSSQKEMQNAIEQLRLSDRTQQERLDALTRR